MDPLRCCCLLLLLCGSVWASDELEKEVGRWQADTEKLNAEHAAAVAKINERTLKVLVRIAQREAKAGNVDAAAAAWKEVLRVDHDHAEAREFFTTANQLDLVLAEVSGEVDMFGNPLPRATARARRVLGFPPGSILRPSLSVLTVDFSERTTELIAGRIIGDCMLFEEGGGSNGQAIGVIGNEAHYVCRAGGTPLEIKAPFDRAVPWTHIAVQYAAGEMSLWLNGKLAAKGKAPFARIPAHGDGAVGGEYQGSPASWKVDGQFLLAMFRLSNVVRYTADFVPPKDAVVDAQTLLSIGGANLPVIPGGGAGAALPAKVGQFANLPGPGAWSAVGDIFVQTPAGR